MKGAKHCPFCGSEKTVVSRDRWTDEYMVFCNICGVHGPSADTKEEAVFLWNERSDE